MREDHQGESHRDGNREGDLVWTKKSKDHPLCDQTREHDGDDLPERECCWFEGAFVLHLFPPQGARTQDLRLFFAALRLCGRYFPTSVFSYFEPNRISQQLQGVTCAIAARVHRIHSRVMRYRCQDRNKKTEPLAAT